ncbi:MULTISPECIES: ATP-binding protein [unclassified Oceanispirochaeta]|uniref:ATP-binding protein n=1 Tax=unclassified Oceanispirochaeta TaxID=2635722 RepID=UPI000E0933D7|nr:HAMP domain-containing histidine kinase [Oceanispirochaeta sp. M2]NPD75233.1 HAMP domain-containing histidine kinase [Oceanispirochaeta sp. M1]RDG28923.1 sensor histidine kinase [Oceanispirochaeta sp. M1]
MFYYQKGTGSGLYIVRSLVEEKLKGDLSFQSKAGEGTVLRVTLPKDLSKI